LYSSIAAPLISRKLHCMKMNLIFLYEVYSVSYKMAWRLYSQKKCHSFPKICKFRNSVTTDWKPEITHSLVENYQCFRETLTASVFMIEDTLKLKAVATSRMLENFYQTTQCHISEYTILHGITRSSWCFWTLNYCAFGVCVWGGGGVKAGLEAEIKMHCW
jgi:hypothetical protein